LIGLLNEYFRDDTASDGVDFFGRLTFDSLKTGAAEFGERTELGKNLHNRVFNIVSQKLISGRIHDHISKEIPPQAAQTACAAKETS
jgi:hypothetical protein